MEALWNSSVSTVDLFSSFHVFTCLDFLPSKVWRTSRLYHRQPLLSQGV